MVPEMPIIATSTRPMPIFFAENLVVGASEEEEDMNQLEALMTAHR
jgi:hypothetical protein